MSKPSLVGDNQWKNFNIRNEFGDKINHIFINLIRE
jgi:hypothetical protein